MPVYEYICNECEFYFTELKSISKYAQDSFCPECQGLARKVISAPGLNIMRSDLRAAHQTNEKSAHEPKVNHTCGAHCHHHKKTETKPALKQQVNRRPWMLGH